MLLERSCHRDYGLQTESLSSLTWCRFGRKGKNQVKLRTNVLFSMTLNLSQFLSSSIQNNSYSSYHLFAVLVRKHTH